MKLFTKAGALAFFKEVGRLVLFALPAILIQVVSNDPELSLTFGGGLLLFLRALDKSIHDDPKNPLKGLLPF